MLEKDNNLDFRQLLQKELVTRIAKNPSYSLRSFARTLFIEPSSLSRILRGERNLTRSMLHRLANRLEMNPETIEKYEAQHFKDPKPPTLTKEPRRFEALSEAQFHVFSHWYCYAILELTRLSDFDSAPRAIAKRLGISVNQVNFAIERMIEVGMLKVSEEGKLAVDTTNRTTTNRADTSAALRKYQRQILEKAMAVLALVPYEARDQTGMTMAISKARLKEAKNKIQKFRRELSEYLEADPKKDAVYHLSISLFPLTEE